MLKRAFPLIITAVVGIAIGLAYTRWSTHSPAPPAANVGEAVPMVATAEPVANPTTQPAAAPAQTQAAPTATAEAPPVPAAPDSAPSAADKDDDSRARIAALNAQITQEKAARQRLEQELGALQDNLRTLTERLDVMARSQAPEQQASNRKLDAAAFIAAGFDASKAEALSERVGQQEMDALYLRDQAIREGWLDSDRYRTAVNQMNQNRQALRQELGEDDYERFLAAIGEPNRVAVEAVIEGSPAQQRGLQPGDQIVRYAGDRIYSGNELRTATSAGDPNETVAVEVNRNGQRIEFFVPRGPLGVRLDAVSVTP